MFVESSHRWDGVNAEGVSFACDRTRRVSHRGKQVEEHLREIIDYDRRLSELQGVDIQVTIKESEQFAREAPHVERSDIPSIGAEGIAMAPRAHGAAAKSNVIGLVFQLDYT